MRVVLSDGVPTTVRDSDGTASLSADAPRDRRSDTELSRLSARILAGKAFLIKTPVAIEYYSRLEEWLTVGFHGGVIAGRSRLGKTSATRWTLKALNQTLGCVPWVEVPTRKADLPVDKRAFYGYVLNRLGLRYAKYGRIAEKQDRLTEALVTRARRSTIRTAVLFFDEAQYLTPTHYFQLVSLSNELDASGYRLFCLFVGQERLNERVDGIIGEGFEEIAGRFFIGRWEFPAISSKQAFLECFQQYDLARYPTADGAPFTSWFVPKAFDGGFRLEPFGEAFWKVFSDVCADAHKEGPVKVPMHYLSASLVLFLNALVCRDASRLVVKFDDVKGAVNRCGYAQSLCLLQPARKKR